MSHHHVLDKYVQQLLPENLSNKKLLDAACGIGFWGFFVRTRSIKQPYLIGIDVWRFALAKINKMKVYDELIQSDVLLLPFKDGVFDVVIACEVLEHLPQKQGYVFLDELERICKEQLIVTTPFGFLPQRETIFGNPYDNHVSKWFPKDFVDRNYNVKVVNPLPKSLYILDRIRRLIFNCPPPLREIIAWKNKP